MEPLLRWLNVGARGYQHGCIPDHNARDNHLENILSSAAFADDLLCPTSTIQDLKVQAQKLTLNSDWAALIISGSQTKATGILRSHPSKDLNGVTPTQLLSHNLLDKIEIQGQKAQFLPSDKPFSYLGVQLTMDLNWKHQIQNMTCKLGDKLEKLDFSASSKRYDMYCY